VYKIIFMNMLLHFCFLCYICVSYIVQFSYLVRHVYGAVTNQFNYRLFRLDLLLVLTVRVTFDAKQKMLHQ